MLHFVQFLEFIVGLVVMALALALNYKDGFPGWPIANILLLTAGAFGVFVIIVSHCVLRRSAQPGIAIVLLHVLAFAMALGTFVWCFMNFPYQDCRNGTIQDGCGTEKAAVPMDGVLMGLFFISSLILFYDLFFWNRKNHGSREGRRHVSRWYY